MVKTSIPWRAGLRSRLLLKRWAALTCYSWRLLALSEVAGSKSWTDGSDERALYGTLAPMFGSHVFQYAAWSLSRIRHVKKQHQIPGKRRRKRLFPSPVRIPQAQQGRREHTILLKKPCANEHSHQIPLLKPITSPTLSSLFLLLESQPRAQTLFFLVNAKKLVVCCEWIGSLCALVSWSGMHTYFWIICVNRKILIEEDSLIDGGYHHYRRCLFSEFPQGKARSLACSAFGIWWFIRFWLVINSDETVVNLE